MAVSSMAEYYAHEHIYLVSGFKLSPHPQMNYPFVLKRLKIQKTTPKFNATLPILPQAKPSHFPHKFFLAVFLIGTQT